MAIDPDNIIDEKVGLDITSPTGEVPGGANGLTVTNIDIPNSESDNKFYFKIKPKNGSIKVKSSVVLPLPLYDHNAEGEIKIAPNYGYSEHNGKPLSFEYIYKNFDAEDFAQLLVSHGVLSKAIRYALLYNYFGYPVANYSIGTGGFETEDIGYAKYNNLAKRCIGTDFSLITQLHKPKGIIWSGENYQTALYERYLVDYMSGYYQLGEMGEIPSFNGIGWSQGLAEGAGFFIEYYFSPMNYGELKANFENYPDKYTGYASTDTEPELPTEYIPSFEGLYRRLHGIFGNDDPSYVEPIGIDAQYSGLSAWQGSTVWDQPGSEVLTTAGSQVNSLYFNPSWGVPTNTVHKTHVRAWMPSDSWQALAYGKNTTGAFYDDEPEAPPPAYFQYVGSDTEAVYQNNVWYQTTFCNFAKFNGAPTGEAAIDFNSLAYITGNPWWEPKLPSTQNITINDDNTGQIYHNFWDTTSFAFKSWYHNLQESAHLPEGEEDFGYLGTTGWRGLWEKSNIVSMYKLVPPGISTKEELDKFREDPSKTLNAIWPRIWDYVERITPSKMYQSNHPSYGDNVPGAEDGSALNSSDVITSAYGSGPDGYVAYDWTRKFRIGHQLTPTKAAWNEGPFGTPAPYDGPVPSAEQGPELGFTHTIGDSGDRGFHLSYGQDVYQEGLSFQVSQTAAQIRFRNKLSLNFKTDLHRGLFWDSLFDGGFGSVSGKFMDIPYGEQQVIQPPFAIDVTSNKPYISYKFKNDYKVTVDLDQQWSSAIKDDDGSSVTKPNDWEDELDYSYWLSTKMLTYLYLKAPAGCLNKLPSDDPDSDAQLGARHAVTTTKDVLEASTFSKVHFPTAHNQSDLEYFYQFGSYGYFQTLDPEQYGVDTFNEEKEVPNAYYNGNSDAFKVTAQSKFALPVWFYEEGTSWDPKNIAWPKLSASQKKLDKLEQAGTLEKFAGIENLTNYGLPSWVRSIKIYPCPDKEIIPTNPNAYGIAGIGHELQEPPVQPALFPTDKDSEGQPKGTNDGFAKFTYTGAQDCASAALKLHLEPDTTKTLDKYGLEMNANSSLVMQRHVDVRYVVELDIDEKELILTMAGQGVFQLDGTLEQYEDIGISLEDIAEKTFGNVSSEDIIGQLDSGNYDFDIVGNGKIDFEKMPGAGIFPPSEVEGICALFTDPDLIEKAYNIMENNPANIPVEDPWKCTSYLCLKDIGQPTYRLKKDPGKDADNIGYLDDGTIVKVTKEWANGKGEYNKVLIVDDSSPYFMEEGYLPPQLLKPLFPNTQEETKIFFDQKFPLNLAQSPKLEMSEMAKALIPNWWSLEEPYYHREDMEYWANVELPYECVLDDQDLEIKKQEAIIIGIKQLFDFYNVLYTDEDVNTLAGTYLAAKADGCYIDPRPGSSIKVLVKVGAIYLKAFPTQEKKFQEIKANSTRILSLDSRHYQTHLQHAIFSLNKIYLDIFTSKFAVPGLDLEAEAQRLSYVPVALKKMLAVNDLGSGNEDRQDIINIGFDENYALTFVSIIENAGPDSNPDSTEEKFVSIGFDLYKNSEPFNFPNTMSLLFHHREIKNPVLKWQTVVEKWMINPTYNIVPSDEAGPLNLPSNNCGLKYFDLPPITQILMNIGQSIDLGLDLHPRYDLGAFQFNLLQFFPPCPKPAPGKGSPFYKLLSEIDGQTVDFSQMDFMEALEDEASRVQQYVGDWLSSGAALRDIRNKIFNLDDLYTYVLNYITPEVLYSKICKCFLDLMNIEDIPIPNFEISAEGGSGGLNLDPNTLKNNPNNIYSQDKKASFNTNFVDKDGKLKNKDAFMEKLAAEDLFCSFCFNIPSVFFRLPTTNLLDFLIAALKAALEFALAQILLELIMALLDALLTCPEINCPSSQGGIRDYGAQSLSELAPEGIETYKECGIPIDGINITNDMVSTFLEECSNSLTTSEVLGLLDGSATKETLKVIQKILKKHPKLSGQIGTTAQLTTLFSCVGNKAGPDTLDALAFEVTTLVDDKALCKELITSSEQAILDKCGTISDAVSLVSKVLNPDFSKYADIARIIRDNDDLSTQLPPLFSDGKGTQALLSGLSTDTANFALQEALETQAVTAESTLMQEMKQLFKAPSVLESVAGVGNIYVKGNEKFAYYKFNGAFNTWMTAAFDNGATHENQLPEFNVLDGDPIPLPNIIRNISNSIKLPPTPFTAELRADLTDDDYVHLTFGQPYDSDGDGSLDYNDSYTFNLNSQSGINLTIAGNPSLLAPDMLELLKKNDLELNGNCEQSQFLSYLVLSNLGLQNQDQPLFSSKEKFKDMLESEVYVSALSSGLINMGNIVSKSKLLESYDIGFWNAVSATLGAVTVGAVPMVASAILSDPTLNPLDLLEKFLPELKRQQLEKVNLISSNAPDSGGNIRRTFVDFDFGIELAKVEYDFSKYYDPNAPFIGMPHYAMLESVVSNMMQLFVGEALVRGVFILPFFPKEVFLNDDIGNFVLSLLDSYLNTKAGSAGPKFRTTLMRMIYNKTEFTPNENSAKPLMPGESQDIDALVAGNLEPFGGKLYDANYGREYEINSWKDCALYYIRKNMERPLSYIKEKLSNTTLGGGASMDKEVNPYFLMIQPGVREVHSFPYMNWEGTKPNNSSSTLVQNGMIDTTKNGAFVMQYYFRIEDLPADDPMFYEYLAARTKVMLSNTPVGIIDGDDWSPPVNEEEEELVDEILNPFDEDYEGYPWPGGQPTDFVGDPQSQNQFLLFAPADNSLKGVVNRNGLYRLWQAMSVLEQNTLQGNYQITKDDQTKSFASFFKSIKLGVRLCYVVGNTTEVDPETLTPIVDLGDVPQKQQIKDFTSNVVKLMDEDKLTDKILAVKQTVEKIMLIRESYEGAIDTSVVLPLISKEIDITDEDIFQGSVQSFNVSQTGDALGAILMDGQINMKLSGLIAGILSSVEGRTLFKYSIPIPKLASMLFMYNAIGVSTDEKIDNAFVKTKEIIKQNFESIYDIKGSNAYKYQPQYIKDRGGPKGIAASAVEKS